MTITKFLAVLCAGITCLLLVAAPTAALAQKAPKIRTKTPLVTPKGPIFVPNFNIVIRPSGSKPAATATPAPKPKAIAKPQKPKPPVYRNGIVHPKPRPVLAFGRPALLDAPAEPRKIVVLMHDEGKAFSDIAAEYGLNLISRERLTMFDADIAVLEAKNDAEIDPVVTRLLADKRIIGAQPDYVFELQQDDAQANTMATLQYAPQRMEIAQAHNLTRGDGAKIAIIDTGVDNTHAEFTLPFVAIDLATAPAAQPEAHGTAIAGLIGARGKLVGIAPSAQMISVRAFAEAENGKFLSDSYTIARAIDQSVAEGAQIINMSFAGPADPIVLKMMDLLADRDVLVVAAAGNNGPGAPAAYPGAHPHAIAVTATDANDALYVSANRGIYIAIAAPGVDVIAPAPGGTYTLNSGTSIATAHVSGIAALLISRAPNLTRAEILDLLGTSATDFGAPGKDPEFGNGLVDAFKAAALAVGPGSS